MAVSDQQVQELLEALVRGRQSWIDGTLGYRRGFDVAQDDDVTLFGPFGGEALRAPSS